MEELVHQQAVQWENDNRTGSPDMLGFPQVVYNIVATTCHLDDIPNMPNPRTDKKL